MHRSVAIVTLALVVFVSGCSAGSSQATDPGDGSDSWIVGRWTGEVIDTEMSIEFSPDGEYEWTDIDTGEQAATGTWSAATDASPVVLRQATGQSLVFSVLPYAVFDGEQLHITAQEDHLIRASVAPDAQQGNIEALMAELRDHPNVASADFVTAEDATEEARNAPRQAGEAPGDDPVSARIDITLEDWALQGEFLAWLEDNANYRVVRASSAPVAEPGGLVFDRAD